MSKWFFIVTFCFSWSALLSQSDKDSNWLLRVEYGVEANDTRRSNLTPPLNDQPGIFSFEYWGTYYMGLDLGFKIIGHDRFKLYGGLGLSYELATYRRSFNHFYFIDGYSDGLERYTNRYRKVKMPLILNAIVQIKRPFYLSVDTRANWLIYRHITNTSSTRGQFPYRHAVFEQEAIFLRLGFIYRYDNLLVGLYGRVINFEIPDYVLFNTGSNLEWGRFNPIRLDLSFGYTW